jgi:hypothetical protein
VQGWFSRLPERLFGKDVTVGEDYVGSLAAAYKELLDKQRAVLEGDDSLTPDEYQAVIDDIQAIIDAIQAEIDWLGRAVEELDKRKGYAEKARQDAEDAWIQASHADTGGICRDMMIRQQVALIYLPSNSLSNSGRFGGIFALDCQRR